MSETDNLRVGGSRRLCTELTMVVRLAFLTESFGINLDLVDFEHCNYYDDTASPGSSVI